MTLINLTALQTALGAPTPVVDGYVSVTYWAGTRAFVNVSGADVTFPAPIRVDITDGVPESPLNLVPTGSVCCAKITVRSSLGAGWSKTRHVEIPASGPVDFGDLVDVDPASFEPVDPTPTLVETIDQRVEVVAAGMIEDEVADYLTANPPSVADGSITSAKIADGTIVNADVNAAAAIAQSKIAGLVADLSGKAPTVHTHAVGDITASGTPNGTTYLRGDGAWATPAGGGGAVDSVNSQTGAVVLDQDDIGDGTTAKQYTATEKTKLAGITAGATANQPDATVNAALAAKAPLLSPAFTGTPTGITKSHVGLGNVDNTADTAKPVSTAQAAADTAVANAAVAKATIDAKGDLLVGTANDTIARLGVGTDGQALLADSSQTAGVKWGSAGGGGTGLPPYRSGDWTRPYGYKLGDWGDSDYLEGKVWACLHYLEAGSAVSARIRVHTAATASATADLVLYRASDLALVGTFGNVAIDSTGDKTATPGSPIVVARGFYLAGFRPRQAVGAGRMKSYTMVSFGQGMSDDMDYSPSGGFNYDVSGTGAAPASLAAYSRNHSGNSPAIILAVAP